VGFEIRIVELGVIRKEHRRPVIGRGPRYLLR